MSKPKIKWIDAIDKAVKKHKRPVRLEWKRFCQEENRLQKSQILILPEHFDKILLSIFCVTYNDLGDKLLGEFRGNFGHI